MGLSDVGMRDIEGRLVGPLEGKILGCLVGCAEGLIGARDVGTTVGGAETSLCNGSDNTIDRSEYDPAALH